VYRSFLSFPLFARRLANWRRPISPKRFSVGVPSHPSQVPVVKVVTLPIAVMITNRDNAYLILLEDVRDNALTPRNVLRRLARSGGQVSRRQFWNAVKCSRDARHDGDFSRASTQHSRLSANMAVKRFDSTPERSDGSFDPHESKFAFLHWVRSPTPGVRLWGELWSDLYSTSVVRAPHGSTARWGAQED